MFQISKGFATSWVKAVKTEENQVWREFFGIMTAIYVDVNRWEHAFDMKLAR